MRGGQSTASATSTPCALIATKRGVAKSKRLAPRIKKRVVKKANDYPAIIWGLSTELCRFLLISCANAEEIVN
jgi:hypothetical protein